MAVTTAPQRYRVAAHPSRPERLALIRPDGTVAGWFAYDETRAEALAECRRAGIDVVKDEALA